jgi:hypothetical protein
MTITALKSLLESRNFPPLTIVNDHTLATTNTEITLTSNIEIHEYPPSDPLNGFCLNIGPDPSDTPTWDEWLNHPARNKRVETPG